MIWSYKIDPREVVLQQMDHDQQECASNSCCMRKEQYCPCRWHILLIYGLIIGWEKEIQDKLEYFDMINKFI